MVTQKDCLLANVLHSEAILALYILFWSVCSLCMNYLQAPTSTVLQKLILSYGNFFQGCLHAQNQYLPFARNMNLALASGFTVRICHSFTSYWVVGAHNLSKTDIHWYLVKGNTNFPPFFLYPKLRS